MVLKTNNKVYVIGIVYHFVLSQLSIVQLINPKMIHNTHALNICGYLSQYLKKNERVLFVFFVSLRKLINHVTTCILILYINKYMYIINKEDTLHP